jgi:hypothetical protein
MTAPFLIPDKQLRALTATRQGRVSIAGYNYQAAYAVARLVAMALRQPVLDLEDWPTQLRYDWGEDLDEACNDNTVRFTQCKRVATIGQPASLAEVLLGFAPKWLWVPESQRDKLGFRLVCTDPRFADGEALTKEVKDEVWKNFSKQLGGPAKQRSDRAQWADEAEKVGHDVLFEALWSRLECVYLSGEVIESGPGGPRLEAEEEALVLLLKWGQIDASYQPQVLEKLRRLIHDNLITFDPANESAALSIANEPRLLFRADVEGAINSFRPASHRPAPFRLVDRTFLSEQRELERKQFVARQPEWSDLVHGPDDTIKFIERDQTDALERAVLEEVVARIGGAGKLPALFVIGAPGDGKTTLTRRVAARLVDAGTVLIADTGVGLQEPPGNPDEYVQAIEKIQEFGRPVILLLDDPVYAGSPWLAVLQKLNRPGLRVGVLAASPQFLLEEHKSELRACRVKPFSMARISEGEREALAAVHGRTVTHRSEDDFLVVAMEAAAGVSFSEIIERLWLTLADGRDLSSARRLDDLPWEMRAYLFVCFFSRAYESCPEPLLHKLLEISGGVSSTADVALELERMKQFTGWRIFRIGQATRADRSGQRSWTTRKARWTWASMDYEGAPIAAAHAVIARQAWEQRPLPWCDVGKEIIEGSLAVPTVIRDVVSVAVRLTSMTVTKAEWSKDGDDFAKRLIERWFAEPTVETQHLSRMVLSFSKLRRAKWVWPFRQKLVDRAIPDAQGWLAAQRLYFIPSKGTSRLGFPEELDLEAIIRSADFYYSATAATHFGQLLEPFANLRHAYISRLFDAFDGKLEWRLSPVLLTYLLTIAPIDDLLDRVSQIIGWMDDNPEDGHVRTQYLAFVLKLPEELASLREAAARNTANWLDEHTDNNYVRTQYLSFLLKLPAEFAHLREAAAWQTAKWLDDHPEDSSVRTQYLSFLLKLRKDPSHLQAAAIQTEKWLDEHPDDNEVRTQYLSFVLKLPKEFSDPRVAVIKQTAEWLDQHPKDSIVRTKFLAFLIALPAEFAAEREAAALQTAQWLTDQPHDINVREQFLRFLWKMQAVGYWQRLARIALKDAMHLIERSGYQKRHQVMIMSAGRLHQKLVRSLATDDSLVTRQILRRSHKIANTWFHRNRSEDEPQFPLP